jgi:hypothetical protein
MDGNGCKNTYPIFTHIFLSDRNENVNGGNETNGHIWLVGNELNRSGLYWKWLVTGNQVENIDQQNNI